MRFNRRERYGAAATASLAGLAITGTVAALELGRRLFRNARLFSPSSEPVSTWNPADYGFLASRVDEITIRTSDAETLHGWYCRAERPVASALFCHGKTGNLTNVARGARQMVEHGISVLLFDYRGFGRSSGRPSAGGVVRDAVAAARRHETLRPRSLPSILYGYSLGGAIAAQAIQIHPFDGVILQSTFTSLPEMSRVAFPRLPMHLLTGRIFDTGSVVGSLAVPLYVIHGAQDEVVPPDMAERLFAMCPAPRDIDIIEGGLHRNLFDIAANRIAEGVARFAGGLTAGTPAPVGA